MQLKRWHVWTVPSLIMLFSLFWYKNFLVRYAVNAYGLPASFSVTCLSWSMNSLSELKVEKLCIKNDEYIVTIFNAIVSREIALIGKLDVQYKKSQGATSQNVTATPLQIPLIAQRPRISINELTIATEYLSKPISMGLYEHQLNVFRLESDLKGEVAINADAVTVRLHLDSPLIYRNTPKQIKHLKGQTSVIYTGLSVQATADINVESAFTQAQCEVGATVFGQLFLDFDIATASADLDLSKLQTEAVGTTCIDSLPETYVNYVKPLLAHPWDISIPKIARGTTDTIVISKITANNNLTDEVAMTDMEFDINKAQLTFDWHWAHSSNTLGTFIHRAQVGVDEHQFTSQNNLAFQTPELDVNGVNFHAGASDIEFSVNGNITASANFDVSGKGVVQTQMLRYESAQFNDVRAAIEFDVHRGNVTEIDANIELNTDSVNFEQLVLFDISAKANVALDKLQNVVLRSESSVGKIQHADLQIKGVEQQLFVNAKLDTSESHAKFRLQTAIDAIKTPSMKTGGIDIASQGDFNRSLSLEHIISYAEQELLLEHQLTPQGHPFTLTIAPQPVVNLQPLLTQVMPQLQVTQGTLNGKIDGDLALQEADFRGQLKDVSVLYDSHFIDGVDTTFSGSLSSGDIKIENSKLNIEQIRTGAVLSNITADYWVDGQQATIAKLRANVFNGQVYLPQLHVFAEQQVLALSLLDLDLGMLAEAGRDAGIALSGRVSGKLPIFINGNAISIENGTLYNVDTGQLVVEDNASVNALKAQQPSLTTVIGLLDNLTVNTLTSDVNLTADGWLTLGVKIVGENEEQAQPVNFNYTHTENIFTLFKALRLSDEITQRVEQALTK
ncbi:YdbH domain-containing protein [Pseudoalteromonas sp. MMG013]|uniref:intermembrane phospholipid transport protein YdbH family protein n=1 Tax=Pseudoalteromonas sp. MMG013 TaxID=2822687 RepID=UPI001B37FCAB|nr:YdbH domain-containing protein [Pseudoalteromonas sp. MMG013]MBQ4860970.1 YdbH domain-containing protein [Pseudoalteromonas sp. MMG013]